MIDDKSNDRIKNVTFCIQIYEGALFQIKNQFIHVSVIPVASKVLIRHANRIALT